MSKKWDTHKEEILRLYIVENLKLDQIIDHMMRTYDFDQKKSHYEYRLKLWGARKYIKKEVLEYISHQDRSRGPSHGLDYGIYVADGMLLSESRVNRARQRYNLDISLARKYGRAPSPKLPPGHIIQRTSLPAPAIAIDWPKSHPWLRFEERFKIVMPQSSRFILVLAQAVKNCGLISGVNIEDSSHLARAIYASSQETHVNAADLARMLSCTPTNSQSTTVDTSLPNLNDTATNTLKAYLFRVSNKLHGHRGENWRKDLLSLFHQLDETNTSVLSYLTNSKDPTSEAIIECLYEAAIEQGATALAARLLETGMDANALLSINVFSQLEARCGNASVMLSDNLHSLTALQHAALTCNIRSASILIKFGAKAGLGQPTPLQILCISSEVGHPDTLQFADLLISHGAQVNWNSNNWLSPLEGAVLRRNRSLVSFLLQHGATDVLHDGRFGPYQEFLRTERLTFILRPLREPLLSALQVAIITKDDSIVKALISSIAVQEDGGNELLIQAFITACVAGDQDFVRVILEHFDHQLAENEEWIEPAFFGAAWDMDCRIAKLLVKHRVVRRKLQNACLPIFQAAALHGNTSLIMTLHSSGFDINSGPSLKFILLDQWKMEEAFPPPMSSSPLGCAVWMNHKDAVEILMDLGADIACIDLIAAIKSGSFELSTQVLRRCGNSQELCIRHSALDVAIRCRTGLEMICKLVDAGAIIKGHELADAVRSNDQEVVNFLLPACDILAINPSGETVLEAACYMGNLDIVLQYFACGGLSGSRALFLAVSRAIQMHDYRFIEHVVVNRSPGSIDEYEASALALSIRMNDTVLTDMLLHENFRSSNALSIYKGHSFSLPLFERWVEFIIPPPDFKDFSFAIEEVAPKSDGRYDNYLSPLLVAADSVQERVVRRMLEHGYLVDPYLLDIIHEYESPSIYKEIRDMIISAYASRLPNVADRDWDQRMLLVALKHGLDLGIIQQHFAKLPSLNYDQGGACPLGSAVRSGSYDHVRAVLEAGATADARKCYPAAEAFWEATKCGSLEIVSLLLDYGADINHDPRKCFNSALGNGDLRMAVFLLDHGLKFDTPLGGCLSGFHNTCLECTAKLGRIDAVELLFSRGVDIQGRARIHFIRSVGLATNRCHYVTAKLLKDRGGWNDGDDELARTPRGRDLYHTCPRFVYDDLTLEGCDRCETDVDTSSESDLSDEDNGTNNSTCSYEAADEQCKSDEIGPLANDISMLDIESDVMEYELVTQMYEWPSISYGRQDRELDTIVQGLLLEDGVIT